jgi:serine/threonine-protein kinase
MLGFFQGEQTKTVDLERGVVQAFPGIAADDRPGATWNDEGAIVVATQSGLVAVPAAGGEAQAVPTSTFDAADGGTAAEILAPSFLPDGNHFVYLLRNYGTDEPQGELRVGSLDGSRDELVMRSDSNALYAPSGELVWWQDGNLRAQPFDLDRLELTGAPRVVRGGVQFDPRDGVAAFSIARDGTIVYREGGVVAGDQLALVDRGGGDRAVAAPPGNYYSPKLSPDGALVAVDQSDVANRGDVWVYEIARRTGARLTSAPEDETEPVWSPDGRQVAFVRAAGEGGSMHVRSVRGADDERKLTQAEDDRLSLAPRSWSASSTIVAESQGKSPFRGLAFLEVADGTLELAPSGTFHDSHPAFSPDGRFLALESDATGRLEVYVRPFPNETDRWRVSIDGGRTPFWRSDGAELYFVSPRSEIVAVSVRPGPDGTSLTFGEPETLFRAELKSTTAHRQIDTIDGRTFVVNRTMIDVEVAPFTVIAYGLAPGSR